MQGCSKPARLSRLNLTSPSNHVINLIVRDILSILMRKDFSETRVTTEVPQESQDSIEELSEDAAFFADETAIAVDLLLSFSAFGTEDTIRGLSTIF